MFFCDSKISLVERVKFVIDDFSLLKENEKVVVGFSGGKDSLFLVLVLRELGYDVIPVVVDYGFDKKWMRWIYDISKRYFFDVKIIEMKNSSFKGESMYNDVLGMIDYNSALKGIGSDNITPCTQCYNVKMLAMLSFAAELQCYKIALGHHLDDAISSMLKTYLYCYDSLVQKRKSFDIHIFYDLVKSFKAAALSDGLCFFDTFYCENFLDYCASGFVATEEPPKKAINMYTISCDIIRPLFALEKNDIELFFEKEKIDFESQKCILRCSTYLSPREIVDKEIMSELKYIDSERNVKKFFIEQILKNLEPDGALVVDARMQRDKVLGSDYKRGYNTIKL